MQMLAGHAALSTTQRYIEADVEAQRKVVDLVCGSTRYSAESALSAAAVTPNSRGPSTAGNNSKVVGRSSRRNSTAGKRDSKADSMGSRTHTRSHTRSRDPNPCATSDALSGAGDYPEWPAMVLAKPAQRRG